MKKKIILGLSAYSVLFLFTGFYIVYTIHIGTAKLNDLIRLHQVEIIREQFLIQIKRVQSDLALKHTHYSRKSVIMLNNIRGIEDVIDACFGCHHSAAVQAFIDDLHDSTHRYKDAVGRALSAHKGAALKAEEEEDIAFRAGEVLTGKVHDMVALTNAKLKVMTEKALGDIARSKYVLYVLLAMGPLLSLGLAALFIRGFTTPVNRLLEATRSLKSGNLDHKVEGMKEEFGELASSFNEMAGSIKEQMLRMREAEQTLEKANQELKHTQGQMVRAETMAALGTLSSGISHELSTPLSVILNMTQLMKREVKDDPALLKDMEVVEYEVNQAIKVTRSLLGFARSTRTNKEPVDVNRILEDLFKILEFQPAAKSVKRNKRLAPDLPVIHSNSGQIRQVFLNIILNAIQAMPEGGELDISTGRWRTDVKNGVVITIGDTGSGIPKEDIGKIFQPFFTTKEEGTGLGLAISYGIIKEHNGNIEVESEVGRGTTFRVFLPEGTPQETRA
jgi:two-component system NtrC family sensor kinase